MITYIQNGNLLESGAFALVNPVNCVGVMGKGLALEFKRKFPENFRLYQEACKFGSVEVGRMFVTNTPMGLRRIINFPTKKHWRDPSEIDWINAGLASLRELVLEKDIKSIAMPALGCGNGGLRWQFVRPLIEGNFRMLSGVEIMVYEPIEAKRSR